MHLADLLTPALAGFLQRPPAERCYHSLEEIDDILARWARAGARLTLLGYSSEGRPIRCASFGAADKNMLAWGYPHPDEPLGAEALIWLGDALSRRQLPDLQKWAFHLVICADPDQVARNHTWLQGPPTAENFVSSCWRPQHLCLEADYGFECDWGPFVPLPAGGRLLTRCSSQQECWERCGEGGCRTQGRPPRPLAESQALARAIDLFAPDVAATMHGVHAGDDYTFLLTAELPQTMDALLALPQLCGTGRYLGERIDPGRRWRTRVPDLLHEGTLQDAINSLRHQPGYDPQAAYYATLSAAGYLQAREGNAQLLTPEAAQFRHPDFSDASPLGETTQVRVSVQERRRGRYRVQEILTAQGWLVAHQQPTADAVADLGVVELALTRGMEGVKMVSQRRVVLHHADRLWEQVSQLPDLIAHPYQDERHFLNVPGAYVNDRSMLIYRTREDYRRPITRAQAASLRWRGAMHTAAMLGGLGNFLAHQDLERPDIQLAQKRLHELQAPLLAQLPPELQQEAPHGPAMRSMLARLFVLLLAR